MLHKQNSAAEINRMLNERVTKVAIKWETPILFALKNDGSIRFFSCLS